MTQPRHLGANPDVQSRHLHKREEVMGTVVALDTYGEGAEPPREVHVRAARASAVLQRADAVFSTWKEHSPLNQFRRSEITLDQAPPDLAEVLQGCERAKLLSDGFFDAWALPGGVDPSGYVKGWVAQRAAEVLYGPEMGGAVVNAAGDIATYGSPAPGQPYEALVIGYDGSWYATSGFPFAPLGSPDGRAHQQPVEASCER